MEPGAEGLAGPHDTPGAALPTVWSLHNGTPLTTDDAVFANERALVQCSSIEAHFVTVHEARKPGGLTSGTKPTALGCRDIFNTGGYFTRASTR